MLWIELSDVNELHQLRTELEESRQALEIARSGYAPFLTEKELQQLCGESSDLLKRAVKLRTNVGERIFILERDEISCHSMARSSSSKRTRSSSASEIRARAVAEAAKRKVEWQYAKMEMQKKLELKMKECGKIMKVLRLRLPPWLKSKKWKKMKNTCLVAWMIAKLIRKSKYGNICQRCPLHLHKPLSR